MPTDLLLPMVSEMDDGALAARAEDLSYDGLWLGELWGASSVVRLTEIATRTDDIDLGTAILNVFSRTPAVLAMTAASLDDVAGGQFKLGVGTSTKKSIEDLHGAEWDDPNPVRRAHETIELTKAYLDGDERVEYEGEVFEVQDFPALGADVPVYHAALGKANRRVVARLCDGWIPHNIPFPVLQDNYEYIREHAEKAGRETTVDVVPYVPAAVADDTEVARDVIRGHVAYYVGNGKGYEQAVAELFPEEADAVATAWRSGDRSTAAEAVTDDMVDALGVAGTPEEARDGLREIADIDCVTRPMVTIPSNADDETATRTIEELAPANR